MAFAMHDSPFVESDAPEGGGVYLTVNPESRVAILQSVCFSVRLWNGRNSSADLRDTQVLSIGTLFFALPFSMIMVLAGALCAGVIAAIWFHAVSRPARDVHVLQIAIKPDAKRELTKKTG